MACEAERFALSRRYDGDLDAAESAALDDHVASCPSCAEFESGLAEIRQTLRFEPLADGPDVVPAVLREIHREPRPQSQQQRRRLRLVPLVAAFVAGAVAGATFFGIDRHRPPSIAAADIAERVAAAQHQVRALSASISIVERGWHPLVPERHFTGTVQYGAPEEFWLHLVDGTAYPSPAWVKNDVDLVATPAALWSSGPRPCPTGAQPTCTPSAPDVRVVTNREPFSDTAVVPLDLITPVESFAVSGGTAALATRVVGGRNTTGVVVTASQVEPLLAGLRPAGNLREVYPADRVELWLDDESLVPLALRVLPASGEDRQRWAATRGYHDEPGVAVLEVTLSDVVVNGPAPSGFPAAPAAAKVFDDGFAAADETSSAAVPAGFEAYRSGTRGSMTILTWTDGRAWIKVRSTMAWTGGRLFGELGDLVLARAGGAYTNEDGTRVALHNPAVDVVVEGSVGVDELLRVAASLGVEGQRVPGDWAEAGTATLADAVDALPSLLVPTGLDGYASPAVRIDGDTVTLAYAGAGTRGFMLVDAPGSVLLPPLDPDARGVLVRNAAGRYSPARGELEWVEDGRTISLHSATLTVEELLAIAQGLAPA